MRAYVPITPSQLKDFLSQGEFEVADALIVEPGALAEAELDETEQEELEFERSWSAALISRQRQESDQAFGFVLAAELSLEQAGKIEGEHVALLSKLEWTQVQSLLVAESEEPELSWFAPQEIATYLSNWMA